MSKKKGVIFPISLFLAIFLLVFWGRRVFAVDLSQLVQEEVTALAEAEETLEVPASETNNQKVIRLEEEVEALIQETEEAPTPVKRGWVGEVVSAEIKKGIIILLKGGGEVTVTFDEETVFVDENRQKITAEDLKKGDFLVVMGYQARLSAPRLAAKRIIKSQPQKLARQSYFGKVSDISQEEAVFSLEENSGQVLEVIAGKAKVIKKEKGKEAVKTNFASLEKGGRVVLVGEKGESGRLEATLIYLWSEGEITPLLSPTGEAF
ncbi:hypothetical protein KBI33_00025 [Candidatus Shapirobacteria bacterium]|nr:hypothetical protein [Candidatus Shapirobacteria bacterium]